jgi:hypothetical protein
MKLLFTFVIIILLALSCFNFFFQKRALNKATLKSMENELSLKAVLGNMFVQIGNEGVPVKNINISDVTRKGDLKSVLGGEAHLILRLPRANCQLCMDSILYYFKKFNTGVPPQRIVILSNFDNARQIETFKGTYALEYEVYHLDDSDIVLPLDKANLPYCFVSDSTLKAKCVFIPEIKMPDVSQQYFSLLQHRFFGKPRN